MERLLLVKMHDIDQISWQIDVSQMPIAKVLEIIISETGDDCQIKRAPGRVIDECLESIKSRAIELKRRLQNDSKSNS